MNSFFTQQQNKQSAEALRPAVEVLRFGLRYNKSNFPALTCFKSTFSRFKTSKHPKIIE